MDTSTQTTLALQVKSTMIENADRGYADHLLKAEKGERERESNAAAALDTTLKETRQRLKDTETENIMLRIELKQLKKEQEKS